MNDRDLAKSGKGPPLEWLQLHLPIVLFAWFWFGMFLCGLLAPAERVSALDSAVLSEGWHISLLCVLLGVPVVVLYWRRLR